MRHFYKLESTIKKMLHPQLKLLTLLLFSCGSLGQNNEDCSYYTQLFACGQTLVCNGSSLGMCLCASQQNCFWSQGGASTTGCPCFGSENQIDNSEIGCLKTFYDNNCGYNSTCIDGNSGACECPDGSFCRWSGDKSDGCPCSGSYPSLEQVLVNKFGEECMDQFEQNNCPMGYDWSCVDNIGNCQCQNGEMCSWTPGWSSGCPC